MPSQPGPPVVLDLNLFAHRKYISYQLSQIMSEAKNENTEQKTAAIAWNWKGYTKITAGRLYQPVKFNFEVVTE